MRGGGSDLHAQFGSVAFGQINRTELSSAADAFVVAWIDAIEDSLPEHLVNLADAMSLDAVLQIIREENDKLIAEQEAAAKAVLEAQRESIRAQIEATELYYQNLLDSLALERELLETQITALQADRETIRQAVLETTQLQEAFEPLRDSNIAREFADALDASKLDPAVRAYRDTRDAVTAIAVTSDSTVDDLRRLQEALVAHKSAVLELAFAYAQASDEIKEITGGAAESIRETRLSDAEILDKRIASFASTLGLLSTATDPTSLVNLTQSLSGFGVQINSLFANLEGAVPKLEDGTLDPSAYVENVRDFITQLQAATELAGLEIESLANFQIPLLSDGSGLTDIAALGDLVSNIIADILEAAGGGAAAKATAEANKAIAEAQALTAAKAAESIEQTGQILANLEARDKELYDKLDSAMTRLEEVANQEEKTAADMAAAIAALQEDLANVGTAAQAIANSAGTMNSAGDKQLQAGETQLNAANQLLSVLSTGGTGGLDEDTLDTLLEVLTDIRDGGIGGQGGDLINA